MGSDYEMLRPHPVRPVGWPHSRNQLIFSGAAHDPPFNAFVTTKLAIWTTCLYPSGWRRCSETSR